MSWGHLDGGSRVMKLMNRSDFNRWPRLQLRVIVVPKILWGSYTKLMIVSMSHWPYLKMLASLLRCSTFSSSLFFAFSSAALLASPLALRRTLSYVYSGGNQFFLAPWCAGCVRCELVRPCGARKHASDVLGPKSDPALDVVKVIVRNMCCRGSLSLRFVHLH